MKKLFLALVCMVTLMAVTSCGGTATPTAAAEEGLEMIKAGNYEGFVETIYFGEKATEEEVKQAKEMYVSPICLLNTVCVLVLLTFAFVVVKFNSILTSFIQPETTLLLILVDGGPGKKYESKTPSI